MVFYTRHEKAKLLVLLAAEKMHSSLTNFNKARLRIKVGMYSCVRMQILLRGVSLTFIAQIYHPEINRKINSADKFALK